MVVQPGRVPDDPGVQAGTGNPESQTHTPTLSDFESAWGALAEIWMADGDGQHLLLARQAMLLLDLVCHIAQTDEAATTLRNFARSLTVFEEFAFGGYVLGERNGHADRHARQRVEAGGADRAWGSHELCSHRCQGPKFRGRGRS